MRKLRFLSTLVLTVLVCSTVSAQDYSNKGKDFWICYPEHINGTGSIMGLYITSDVNTNGVISFNGTNVPFTVTANTIIPRFLTNSGVGANVIGVNTYVHLGGLQDGIKTNAAIRVRADNPVVVYAHIINSARSGASLILPTQVWGKEYIVPSYANSGSGGTGSGYGELGIMASDFNTDVEITPSIVSRNGARTAGTPYTITLANPGDVYQLQFPQNTDLSGTKIRSVASAAGGCKPIAVVSATTWSAINCGSGNGGDNFYQQLFPQSTWGKSFLTSPLKRVLTNPGDFNVDVIRVYVKDPTTIVTKMDNGATVTLGGLVTPGNFFEYTATNPTYLVADKPVQVMQYVLTQGCGAPATPSDPEMIALSSIEQTINDITVYSAFANLVPSGNSAISTHYINVIMKTLNTGSFRINGLVPTAPFNPIPGTAYSFMKQNIPTGGSPVSRLTADSGFTAYAYGFGQVESYGYNAGTNVRDLNQQLEVNNEFGTETSPNVCTNSPFRFKVYFPDQSLGTPPVQIRYDSIKWNCSNIAVMNPANFPVTVVGTPTVTPDSVNIRNGKDVAWYSLPGTYTFTTPGVYDITITVYRTSSEGCGNSQDYTFPLTVTNPPVASFTFVEPGCYLEPAQFIETTAQTPKPTYRFWWSFGDPPSGAANNSTVRNPAHTFTAPGPYTVRFANITTAGCLSDTAEAIITIPDIPTATIDGAVTLCINDPSPNIIFTASGGKAPYTFTYNINGGAPLTISPPGLSNTVSLPVPTGTAGTFRYNLVEVKNTGSSLCVRPLTSFVDVVVIADATITLSSPVGSDNQTVCINNPLPINITYTIGGSGTGATVTGLPVGVTGNFAAGVFTISGTPTVSGVFDYTVSTEGPCDIPTRTGRITVTADATITLTSGPGSDDQTVCINDPLPVAITYNIGGSGSNATVTGLPAGITGVFSAGVLTISGSPTVSGVFNYTVNSVGPCVTPFLTGRITVTADATITLTSAASTTNQTLCINTPIVNITYAIGGSATGATITGLPTGVTGVLAGNVVTISGTPTVSGVFDYIVSTQGPCEIPTRTGRITVTDNATITLTSAPGSDDQTVCINDPLPIAITYNIGGSGNNATVSGLPAGITGVFAGGVLTISGAPTVSGVFNYTVNSVGPCVTPFLTGRITVTADATITLTSAASTTNQTVCINTPIVNITYAIGGSGTGAGVTGLPAGVTGVYAAGVFTISGSPTVTGTFLYTVSTLGPCEVPGASGTITVNADGSITLSSGTADQELCINSAMTPITFQIGGSATGAVVAGLPTGVTGSLAGNTYTIQGTPTVSGVFNYTVTTTGICAPATATGTITVNALPTANFMTTAPSCETRVIDFTDMSVPNSGNITTWTWDFGDGSPPVTISAPASPNISHIYGAANTYNVSLVVTTDKGCVSTNPPRAIVINVRPLAGFMVPEVCINDVATVFTDTSKVSVGTLDPAGYYWNFGDPGSGPLNTATTRHGSHLYTAIGLYTVMHVATSSQGCKDTVYHDIFINAADPIANFAVQNPTTLCANDTISIMNTSTISQGSVTKLEIYWDLVGAPGTFDVINDPVSNGIYKHKYPTLTVTRNYTIRMVAYSGSVCFNTRDIVITVNAAPAVVFGPMPSICYDAAPYQIPPAIARETGGVVGNAVFSGPGVSPTGLFNPSVAGIGTHRILYTYTATAGGCVDTASNLITVWDTATARIDVQALACERSPVSFNSNNSSIPAGNGTITGWTWNFGDPASGAQNISSAPAPTHLFTGWGSYTVTLSVTSSNGCRSTLSTIPVTINPIARPRFDFPPSTCLPSANVLFRNLSTIPDGTESSFSYLWDFGDPASGVNNTAGVKDPSHIYNNTGPYSVNLQVTAGSGCIHDTTIVLNTIHPEPRGTFITDKIDVCIGGSIRFTSTSDPLDGTISQWIWDLADGNTRSVPTFTYTYASIGSYSVTHYIINSFGCRSNTATTVVSVNPYPPANAGPSKFMLEGGQVQLTPLVNVSYPVTYLWTPGRYVTDSTIAMPYAFPPDDMYFKLTVSAKGCSTSDTMFVKVLKAPDVPNIFSPNGDGINDRWEIQYLNTYPGGTLDVVNRYGQLVFRSVGYPTPWDGKVNGVDVPVGTYYYVIDPKNGRKPKTGYVDIIR